MSRTLNNLVAAYVGESQARNRYAFYASTARKEWFLQIASIFEETADQEKEHASWLFKMIIAVKAKEWITLDETHLETEIFVKSGTTLENLGYAIAWETHEFESMYPEFAKIAAEEWFMDVAARLTQIAVAEAHHAERYQKLQAELANNTLRNKDEEVERVCTKCGHVHKGKNPNKVCPVCGHDETYAVVKNENY